MICLLDVDLLLEENNLDDITIYDFGKYFKENFNFLLNEQTKSNNKTTSKLLNKHKKIALEIGFNGKKFEDDLIKDIKKERDSFGNISLNDKNLKNKIESYTEKVKDICNKKINNIKEYFTDKEKLKDLGKQSLKSVILLICVVTVNSVLDEMIKTAVPGLAGVILGLVRGPFIEELGKRIADKYDFPVVYNIIFNTAEFSTYVNSLIKMGVKPSKAILARSLGVILHTLDMYIIKNAGKNESDPAIKNKKKNLAMIVTFILHTAFNTFAVLNKKAIKNWVTK